MAWIWTTRPGFAGDLVEELGGRVRQEGPSVVYADGPSRTWPIFARAGFPIAYDGAATVEALVPALEGLLLEGFPKKPWLLHTWVPDSDATNSLGPVAQSLGDQIVVAIEKARPDLALLRVASADAARYGGVLVQICLVAAGRALAGAVPAGDVPSLRPGGRARASKPGDAPSRAARKLSEAFEWIGRGPEAGEMCVDLGAAPGGWTAVLLARRARVLAVDPAKLAPDLMKKKGLVYVKASAFDFEPDEPVDWLLCDMAWRPLEVAQLLAKWGRRHWATTLVANVKLPMKQRALFARKVVDIVKGGSWQDVRARQLYHDREEITLAAWRT